LYIADVIRLFASLPLLFFAVTAFAQERIAVSPLVSFDFGSPLFINRAQGVLSPFPGTVTGNSLSESFGTGAQFSMPEIISGSKGPIGLTGLIEGIYSRGYFYFNGYSVSGIDRKILLELSALWNIQPFSIRAGPWISQTISRNVYENNPNGIRIAAGDSIASGATHFGISAGIGYDIPDFPIRPEINTHLDLTEVGDAGFNAFTVGISLSYSFDGGVARASARSQTIDSEHRTEVRATLVPSRVRFLVNRSEIMHTVPLERVEQRVKEYRMVDSANAAPRVSQWVLESYRLPQISALCEVDRDANAELHLITGNRNRASFSIPSTGFAGLTFDTAFDLEKSLSWQAALSLMNINEGNRVIAELQTMHSSGIDTACDTLFLPPVDTTGAIQTIVKKQFRFHLSDRFSEYEGGKETLDLLLGRIKALLDSNVRISISEQRNQSSAKHLDLKRKLLDALGTSARNVREEESVDVTDGFLVIIDL
jgi:hypothetical protein